MTSGDIPELAHASSMSLKRSTAQALRLIACKSAIGQAQDSPESSPLPGGRDHASGTNNDAQASATAWGRLPPRVARALFALPGSEAGRAASRLFLLYVSRRDLGLVETPDSSNDWGWQLWSQALRPQAGRRIRCSSPSSIPIASCNRLATAFRLIVAIPILILASTIGNEGTSAAGEQGWRIVGGARAGCSFSPRS